MKRIFYSVEIQTKNGRNRVNVKLFSYKTQLYKLTEKQAKTDFAIKSQRGFFASDSH